MIIRGHGKIVYLVWIALIMAMLVALFLGRWSMGFVALITLLLSFIPSVIEDHFDVELPWPFFTGIVLFIFATLFLGEVVDFYERLWWWDVLLHSASSIGFGLVGFVFVFALFEGDRYAAPAWAISFIAMCFAVTIGVAWEIFEYFMDTVFGLNMQKSGLTDTMWDLIVNMIGASIGAAAGFGFLKGRERGGLSGLIADFVRRNRRIFKKARLRK